MAYLSAAKQFGLASRCQAQNLNTAAPADHFLDFVVWLARTARP